MTGQQMPKLGHGEGTITQDKHGRWIGRYRDGYTATGGIRRREVSGKTPQEVAAKLRKAARERKAGQTQGRSLDVKTWSDQYLAAQRTTRRPATVQTTEWALGKIVPAIGGVKLPALTPAHIRKVHDAIPTDASRRRVHSVLMAMLRAAVREGHAVPPSVLAVEIPQVRRSDRADIPLDHALTLIRAASSRPDAARWLVPFMCGLRQGETLGLTWDRIDLDAGIMRVDRQLQEAAWAHGNDCGCHRSIKAPRCPQRRLAVPHGYEYEVVQGRFILAPVKTTAGERMVPLVPPVVTALRAIRPENPARDSLVFQRPGGGPQRKSWDNAVWHELQDVAGVKHSTGRYYGTHEIRHTTATLLMALEVPLPVIEAIIGHSTAISTRTYLHADQTMSRAALEGVAARILPA